MDLSDVSLPGLIYPEETKFVAHLREMEKRKQDDAIPLIPSTIPELREMLSLCCCKPPNLPGPVWTATELIKMCLWGFKARCAVYVVHSIFL